MEFPRSKPEGTLEAKGVYLTIHPKSSPNADSISFKNEYATDSLNNCRSPDFNSPIGPTKSLDRHYNRVD